MIRKEEKVWNRFSFMYDLVMKKDESAYKHIIEQSVRLMKPDEHILEIATGTGIISLALCNYIQNIEAIDFSTEMIAVAKKKAKQKQISNVHFSVQDACNMKCSSNYFDTVIISNTLHIMPRAEKALEEIKRVLKPDGKLIAPTFLHAHSIKAEMLSKIISLTGFRAYHKWTQKSYHDFLEQNGFRVVNTKLIKASFPIAYVVAIKK